MGKILSCLAFEHDYKLLALAGFICVVGSIVTMRCFAQTRRASGAKKANWLFLASVASGCAIWTTHFVAMIGYNLPIDHGYEPKGTLMSLFLAIGFSVLGLFIAASTKRSYLIELGGAVLGAGISVMHFVGMFALKIAGHIEWDQSIVFVSVFLGCLFGAITMNRIARPITRFSKYGAALALVLSICSMHFSAMGAITITPDPTVLVPPNFFSDRLMVYGVVAVMSLLIATSGSTYMIDHRSHTEAVAKYRRMTLHDSLTGLPNRSYLSIKLAECVKAAHDDTSKVAVVGIDLDRFRDINDVHGHALGDQLLSILAGRFCEKLGDGEFIARTGGDEFVAVCQNAYTLDQAAAFAWKLHVLVCKPINLEQKTFEIGASCGVCVYPNHAETAEELLSRADLATDRAKRSPSDQICLYNSSMDEARRNRSALAIDLKYAIARDQLELYYQPQVDVGTCKLTGFEALVRWNHPEQGIISPADFIPIAEETGLILPVGEWVLRTACFDAANWRRPIKIAVNVAPAQLSQSDLPKMVHEMLLTTGLSPNRLELEITESSIIDDHQHTLHVVRQLKALGVTIAMDDFGTGYSSLSTLQTFPFDKIKIDRSFIDAVTTSEQAAAIVKATILLANSFKIKVLAEGVESQEHLNFLHIEGCHEAQGYFFGKPVPLSEILDKVNELSGDEAEESNADGTREFGSTDGVVTLTG